MICYPPDLYKRVKKQDLKNIQALLFHVWQRMSYVDNG